MDLGSAPCRLGTPLTLPRTRRTEPASRSAPLRRAPLHEPRRIAPPARMAGRDLALHQKGVGVKARLLVHDDAVVNERAHAERGGCADEHTIRLEDPFLERMRLDDASLIEIRFVADFHQRPLSQYASVIEHPAADPD